MLKSRYTCALLLVILATAGVANAAGVSGAIFTTEGSCDGTNMNIFGAKEDVYLDGGPAHPGAAGMPDGYYYVKVTEPSGILLGYSTTAVAHVTAGEFDVCYHLVDILIKASDSSPGYDDTTNGGGEYKVWVSQTADFSGGTNKTDNFKVASDPDDPPPTGHLIVQKFYDSNADGAWTPGEPEINGWEVTIQDNPHAWLDAVEYTPVDYVDVAGGAFTVTESHPAEQNWNHTTATTVNVTMPSDDSVTVQFGNLCLGAGGGLTLGFWSNKNGAKLYDNAVAVAQNLVTANGSAFDPSGHAQFNKWILAATATNMAYMLSAQLAAMTQNVDNGNVSASALVYAPGTGSANSLGYATIGALIDEANDLLAANPVTIASGPERTAQEAVKTALDRANNNLNFVQATVCPFSF
jgi:hypothetical protein